MNKVKLVARDFYIPPNPKELQCDTKAIKKILRHMKNTSRAYFIFNLELTFILEAHASEKHRAWCFAVKKIVPVQKANF